MQLLRFGPYAIALALHLTVAVWLIERIPSGPTGLQGTTQDLRIAFASQAAAAGSESAEPLEEPEAPPTLQPPPPKVAQPIERQPSVPETPPEPRSEIVDQHQIEPPPEPVVVEQKQESTPAPAILENIPSPAPVTEPPPQIADVLIDTPPQPTPQPAAEPIKTEAVAPTLPPPPPETAQRIDLVPPPPPKPPSPKRAAERVDAPIAPVEPPVEVAAPVQTASEATADPDPQQQPTEPAASRSGSHSTEPAPSSNAASTQLASLGEAAQRREDSYFSELRALLEAGKRYPRKARLRRQEGIAVVRFSLDRSGRVASVAIKKSSGHRLLDAEASAMVHRAAPFPPPPSDVPNAALTLSVPIEFGLR